MITKMPKFRAWDKFDKVMREVTLLDYNHNFVGYSYPVFMKSTMHMELMQSTGLFDKKEVEIFEGDVVRQVRTQPTTENETITGVVTMLEGAWSIVNDNKQLASVLWSETAENEIIGNIYENKELLGEEEK